MADEQTPPVQRFIYLLRPSRPGLLVEGPTPDELTVIEEHAAYLRARLDAGELLLAGRTQDQDPNGFGIVVFDAPSEEAARAFVRADPAVAHCVMHAELHPYRLALQRFTD